MNIHNLEPLFHPRRIALVGVTPNPQSVGGKILSNLVGGGFRGVVYPVSPGSEAVLGIPCFPDMASLPKSPDLAIICAPAEQVPALVRACGECGTGGIIVVSAGFREIGQTGRALEEAVAAERARFPGMRLLGPNCLGIIVPGTNMNASFAGGMPRDGHVAFISQSGALCSSVLDWAIEERVGFSYFVSIGNALDVDVGDLIDFFGEDEKTKSIILYIESIGRARQFMSAARSFARSKPILAYKAGRFGASAAAAASHTGAMASEDAVYDAAFQRAGLARVFDIGEIFDCAELLGRQKIPAGPRLCILTNAGGPGVMASDALLASNGVLATLSDESMARLNQCLPPMWSHGNPVDVLGDARSKRFEKAMDVLLEDAGIDALLVILTPQAMTNPDTIAKVVGERARTTQKPVLAAWLGGASMREGIRILNDAGVPTYTTPEQAVRAFMTLVSWGRNLEILYETPRDVAVQIPYDRKQIRNHFHSLVAEEGDILPEHISKMLLDAYGIPATRPYPASTADEAAEIADRIGYPVVLKILSRDITHKSDVGGVALGLTGTDAVRSAFRSMIDTARERAPAARLDGVTVQRMVSRRDSVELILGCRKDPVFGTVIMAGMGGVTAELFGDRALGFPPLNERLARRMLESLKIWPLLTGYRGRPPMNIDSLIEALIRLSYLAADYPEIVELDINPLLVTTTDTIALDARIVLDRNAMGKDQKPYAHLALRPYPEELVRTATLKDGTPVTLRPIRPEDEPLWFDMLRSCSRESIYTRFRSFFHWESHHVAVRYCYIDYEREIAIVAERTENEKRYLIGVGRLIAEPDLHRAEYAVLVTDAWQNRGLGGLLTDYCMEIARMWGIRKVIAQTTSDNPRMVAVFRERDFAIIPDPDGSLVDVEKDIPDTAGPSTELPAGN
ncbi:MAG: bifunctional acetate--CoA ligase family protein/GNAT family N-acetyltransferase [Bacteroidota bacterium]|nr:bifunctional acetate--CoA ligase family protein/GNAT family N-acetyltransferase [Bacteroidota bacterium]